MWLLQWQKCRCFDHIFKNTCKLRRTDILKMAVSSFMTISGNCYKINLLACVQLHVFWEQLWKWNDKKGSHLTSRIIIWNIRWMTVLFFLFSHQIENTTLFGNFRNLICDYSSFFFTFVCVCTKMGVGNLTTKQAFRGRKSKVCPGDLNGYFHYTGRQRTKISAGFTLQTIVLFNL